jgi:hypothetical protein
MAKSYTRKKFNKAIPPDVARQLDSVTDYIKHWTLHELHQLQTQQTTPICIPVKNGYRVGLYMLRVYNNKKCDVFDPNGEIVHGFANQRSAILYTIYTIRKLYKQADNILKLDIEINKNSADIQAWRAHIITAKKRKDYDTVDIRTARMQMAQKQLEIALDKISKIYLTAKYNKIWDL